MDLNIKWKPVKNFTSGRFGYKPEAFVIHIAEGYLEGAFSWFNNPTSKVSSHYMIGRNGEIWQFVKNQDMAWHAGGISKPSWKLLKPGVNPNLYTIGIEHEGSTGEEFTEEMYNSTALLIAELADELGIPLDSDHIIGHYKINSISRINCPGKGVNLNRVKQLAINKTNEMLGTIANLKNKIAQLEAALGAKTGITQVGSETAQELKKALDTVAKLRKENRELKFKIDELQNAPVGKASSSNNVFKKLFSSISDIIKND